MAEGRISAGPETFLSQPEEDCNSRECLQVRFSLPVPSRLETGRSAYLPDAGLRSNPVALLPKGRRRGAVRWPPRAHSLMSNGEVNFPT